MYLSYNYIPTYLVNEGFLNNLEFDVLLGKLLLIERDKSHLTLLNTHKMPAFGWLFLLFEFPSCRISKPRKDRWTWQLYIYYSHMKQCLSTLEQETHRHIMSTFSDWIQTNDYYIVDHSKYTHIDLVSFEYFLSWKRQIFWRLTELL